MKHLNISSTEQTACGDQQSDIARERSEQAEIAYIAAARRAPSAHNAQPWRLYPEDGAPDEAYGSYRLFYAHADKLLADPDDRDALLGMGAFYETLALAAQLEGKRAVFEPGVVQHADGLELGRVRLLALSEGDTLDPLAPFIARRQTNRHPYQSKPLPSELQEELQRLGCTLFDPRTIAPLVRKASIMAWKDTRFVADLKEWTRFQGNPPDGMTCECLHLSWIDRQALRFALWRGRLSALLAWIYAQRDVYLTRRSATIAVLTAQDREPLTLFACGRSLLRAWVMINAASYSYHPISIVIDQPTVNELSSKVKNPVAIFRVGYTPEAAPWSNRRSAAY
ncbi:hypothetical protein KSF_079680 [Reticulibacter mediterranei]|uniref:Nitroreductase n=1 Tax=Reticulibacter mediterranei TaxID=2778369 RepID=A0A8J3IW65_9CHLR|nr:hypothetical protein [Reticulibacter mediterranei]GHO97920.1 hypothetical protein KSF_079680 [Reticulibacter mediterranei]